MGSMLLTLLGTLSPRVYYVSVILFAIGFFCVYVPYNEGKKKQGGQRSTQNAVTWKKKHSPPMSWPKALGVMILCTFIFTVGMTLCIACAVMGQQLMALVGAALGGFALWGMARAGRDFRAGVRSRPKADPPAKNAGAQTIPTFRADSPDHKHITSSGPDAKAKLEQLKTLKEAGVLTQEEYDQKRRELEKED